VIPLDGIDETSMQLMEQAATDIILSDSFRNLVEALKREGCKKKRIVLNK
jgi:hypothetical protein